MHIALHLPLPRCRFKVLSLAYGVKIALATLLVWPGLSWLGIAQPTWAIVTIAAVSDPDLDTARTLVVTRVTNTLVGCLVAILTVLTCGATLASMIAALVLSVLLVTSIVNYPSNWRLAPITVAILMGGAVDGPSQAYALHLAWLRASEILSGSLAALLMAWLMTHTLRWLGRRQEKPEHVAADE